MSRLAELRRAKQRVASAQQALMKAMRQGFPPGSPISWVKGDRRASGVVLEHCHGDRLHARNIRTGGQVTLCAADIIRAGGE